MNRKQERLPYEDSPIQSRVLYEHSEQNASHHQEKHHSMVHELSSSRQDKSKPLRPPPAIAASIKSEVDDQTFNFNKQTEILSREQNSFFRSTNPIIKEEVFDIETELTDQREYFHRYMCVSEETLFTTNVESEISEKSSIVQKSEGQHNIMTTSEEQVKIKNENEDLHNYTDFPERIPLDFSNREHSNIKDGHHFPKREVRLLEQSMYRNLKQCNGQVKDEIMVTKENIDNKTNDSSKKFKCANNNLDISNQVLTNLGMKGSVTNDEGFHQRIKIKDILCVSAQTFDDAVIKEKKEHDPESLKLSFENLTSEKNEAPLNLVIRDFKGGIPVKNKISEDGNACCPSTHLSPFQQNSCTVVVKEQIEIYTESTNNAIDNMKEVITKYTSEVSNEGDYRCNLCHIKFRFKERLSRHMLAHKSFKCEICDKMFFRRDKWSLHMNTHTKEKEYKCTVCDKIYFRSDYLSVHMNTHTKKKEYKCTVCDKIFFRNDYLSIHMNTHTKEKEYKCTVCEKIFYHPASLSTHLNTHTKKKQYKCKFCDKIFYRLNVYCRHLKIHKRERNINV